MEAIGYVEVIGLTDAIMVADHMLKAASVGIKNIENATGGYITVSVTGDVAAVEAAIDAGTADSRVNVVSTTVLANPAEGVPELGQTDAFNNDLPESESGDTATRPKQPVTTQKVETTPAVKQPQVPAVQTTKAKATPTTTKSTTTKSTTTKSTTTKPTTTKPATKKPVSRRKPGRKPATKRPATNKSQPKNKPES
ncbi:BMC domain-containing protein [Levilactobacillus mulengensis]|uniref:BMC domain-containing protein n=1 Tax=Levilactobacillus mulengensis TaxID=2486025 RepID=UPI000F7A608C|nr:BMC domain-containing protein [Levilactobacillus mulengensis]